jgi:hypothetical protein
MGHFSLTHIQRLEDIGLEKNQLILRESNNQWLDLRQKSMNPEYQATRHNDYARTEERRKIDLLP